jgi:Phospholipase_D-nuclease N-terminal
MLLTAESAGYFLPVGVALVFGAVGLVLTAIWIWSLVDALQVSDQRWVEAGQDKVLWVILIAILGILGSLLYVVIPRPALRRRGA